MADTTYHLAESQLENGTIDFYTLLGESPQADEETLRAKIGAIYNHASANRDHRNLNKRREFQALLELLPAARTALLEEPRRARYDAYLAAARDDAAETDFETFMNDLLGNNPTEADRSSLLGVQDKQKPATDSAPPRVIKAPAPPMASEPTPPAGQRSPAPFIGATIGFLLGVVIGLLIFSMNGIVPALLVGLIVGALGFVLFNKKPGGRIGT